MYGLDLLKYVAKNGAIVSESSSHEDTFIIETLGKDAEKTTKGDRFHCLKADRGTVLKLYPPCARDLPEVNRIFQPKTC